MDVRQQTRCSIRAEIPELYFCADMKGYGWCFRKGNILNVGLGRLDKHQLSRHVAEFLDFLKATKRLSFDLPAALAGHAYLLYGRTTRNVVADGMLLVGDAAGLAFSQSGEGIRPAVESGLLAATVIATAHGYSRQQLAAYRTLLSERFGKSEDHWVTRIGSRLPKGWINTAARQLLANSWFTREMILNRWFLRNHEPVLEF
jgi:flavin-dependent dehydrogenase